VRQIENKVISLRDALTTYDDKTLEFLRPIEKEFFGDDDYLDVKDLDELITLLEEIEKDATGASLNAFLAGETTTWESQHPVQVFIRLGRNNVLSFINQVLR